MIRRWMFGLVLSVWLFGCETDDGVGGGSGDSGTGDGGIAVGGSAPESLEGFALTVVEMDDPPVENIWRIEAGAGNDGLATLDAAMADFPFTYVKTGDASSVFSPNTGVEQEYDMLWTSETAGTFDYRFEPGAEATPGSFSITAFE